MGGSWVEQPKPSRNLSYERFWLTMLFGVPPHSPKKIYGPLQDHLPGAELVIPVKYGILGDPEENFEELKAGVAATEAEPVVLIGHSLGAVCARRIAAEQPNAVQMVVTLDDLSEVTGIDTFPYNLPVPRQMSRLILERHFDAIARQSSEATAEKIVAIGSTGSVVSPPNSLSLGEFASRAQRVLFRRVEDVVKDYGPIVDHQVTTGALDHIHLPTNSDVIRFCAEAIGNTLRPVKLENSASLTLIAL